MISLSTLGGGPAETHPADLDEVGRAFWTDRIADLHQFGVRRTAAVWELCHGYALAHQRSVRAVDDLNAFGSRRPGKPSKAWLRTYGKLHNRRLRADRRKTSFWVKFRRLIAHHSPGS